MMQTNQSNARIQQDNMDYCPRQISQYKLPPSVIMSIRTKSMDCKQLTLKLKAHTKTCPICVVKIEQQKMVSIGNCKHLFCVSCLCQYLIFKINLHEKIECPQEGCLQNLDVSKDLFKGLPLQVIQRYRKNEKYDNLKQTERLCPQQACEGILDVSNPTQNPKCSLCSKKFCKSCFFQEHYGPCDPYQLNFFQENLHYRQCSKCKTIIQKIDGCNHITCRCGYQFCYVCRQVWGIRNHFHQQEQVLRHTQAQNWRNLKICGCVTGIFVLQIILVGIILAIVLS